MHEIELVLVLLLMIALLATLARRIGVAYPILMVLGGVVLGVAAGAAGVLHLEPLAPDVVFLLFLPPVLFAAAYFTSVRDLRANLRPITLLAVGLVVASTVAVAVVAQTLVPGMTWPVALMLGAIVSPPDAVSTTAIMSRLGVPKRVVTVLEGESLLNDATALVTYRLALAAALGTGAVSAPEAAANFLFVAAGGVLVGLAVGAIGVFVFRRLDDPPVEVMLSLLMPLAAYLPAEELGFSGVLATVVAGLLLGRNAARVMSSETRLLGSAVWQMVIFVINGSVFLLIGLQLPTILEGLSGRPPGQLAILALAVSVTVVVVRIAWVYPATYVPRMLSASLRARDPAPPWQPVFVVSWAGLRGVVSLGAALAVPLTLPDGSPFPERDLVLFLAFTVILTTLVGQGLTLPWLVRRLGVGAGEGDDPEEEAARRAAAEAAVARIRELSSVWPTHTELLDQLLARYEHRVRHIANDDEPPEVVDQELYEHRLIRRKVIDAEREAVIDLRDRGAISDDVMRRVERELDLEDLRMDA